MGDDERKHQIAHELLLAESYLATAHALILEAGIRDHSHRILVSMKNMREIRSAFETRYPVPITKD